MLQGLYKALCKAMGRKGDIPSTELLAMIVTVTSVVVIHTGFLILIFSYELTFLVEEYGTILLGISFVVFSTLYFWLIKKFKAYSRKQK